MDANNAKALKLLGATRWFRNIVIQNSLIWLSEKLVETVGTSATLTGL
jgi:hypothetical protein